MRTAKLKCINIDKTIDGVTGELLSEKYTFQNNIGVEPNYVKLYLEDLLLLKGLNTGATAVLYSILQRIDYNNIVILNSSVKRLMCAETNLAMNTINKAITHFVKKEILIRKDVAMYIANPYLFGKGKWSNIKEIRIYLGYTLGGKQFKADIQKTKNNDD